MARKREKMSQLHKKTSRKAITSLEQLQILDPPTLGKGKDDENFGAC